MDCPCCRTELVVTGQQRLETLSEHVTDPNGEVCLKDAYECLNEDCPALGQSTWTSGGEHYSKDFRVKILFIDDNDGPFGSRERQSNVEFYKKDENRYLVTDKDYEIELVYKYTANEDGDILSRKETIVVNRKNDKGYFSREGIMEIGAS